MRNPPWLTWAQRLAALSQTGLAYTKDPYDADRFRQIRRIAAEMLAAGSGEPLEVVHGLLSGEEGYATPKVDVRGVVFKDDALLLVRERADGGRWTLPGGWADVLESPAECAVKEVREESGYETRAVKLLAVYDRSRHPHVPVYRNHLYKIFIQCELTGGAPADSVETSGAAFFREHELPGDLSISRVTPAQLHRFFEHLRHPELPADFD